MVNGGCFVGFCNNINATMNTGVLKCFESKKKRGRNSIKQ